MSSITLHIQQVTLNNLRRGRPSAPSQKITTLPVTTKCLPRFLQDPSTPFLFSFHLHFLHSLVACRLVVLLCSRLRAPRGLPDVSTGRSFKTDPSAADPVLPRQPRGVREEKDATFRAGWKIEDRRKRERVEGGR